MLREPLLVVSPWFEARREQYQDALLAVSMAGDWDAWIDFFAEGVAAAAAESQAQVEKLATLQEHLRARVQHAKKRGAAERLAADLVGRPYVTVSVVAQMYGLSVPGATKIVRTFVDLQILTLARFSGPRGAQMFAAADVLRVLNA
jgi:Fic family protein